MKVKTDTIVRTVILALALLNQILTMSGLNPLDISEDTVYTVVSGVAAIVATIWAWWKNNSFTKEAIEADEHMTTLKIK